MCPRIALKLNSERGSILILSLWALVALSVLAVGLAQSVQQKIKVYQRLEARQEARAMTEAAIKKVVVDFQLFYEDSPDAEEEALLLQHLSRGEMPIGKGNVSYEVEDEGKKINVNTSRPELLAYLFHHVAHLGQEPANRLAYAIVDYRDNDDFVSAYFGQGSESDAYAQSGLRHGPKNAEFEIVSELLLVKGMTSDVFRRVRDLVTVHGGGRVNINTAPREVLSAVDMHPELVEKILTLRNGPDRFAGTSDDHFFEKTESIESELSQVYTLEEEEVVTLRHAIAYDITTSSEYYRILAKARIGRGSVLQRTACIFGFESGIKYWMEY